MFELEPVENRRMNLSEYSHAPSVDDEIATATVDKCGIFRFLCLIVDGQLAADSIGTGICLGKIRSCMHTHACGLLVGPET